MERHSSLAGVAVDIASGLSIPAHDYITLTEASTTDTYVYKKGGSSGTTVATIVVTFTDSGKGTLSTVAKTPF